MDVSSLVFIGTQSCVAAVSKADGQTIWNIDLGGGFGGPLFVTLCCDGEQVYAHTKGELFCLDALTGQLLWNNKLKGMGYQLGSLCVAGQPPVFGAATAQEFETQREHTASSSQNNP